MEASSERERYRCNPLRLLRGAVEITRFMLTQVDAPEEGRYTPVEITLVEAPVQTEDELLQ